MPYLRLLLELQAFIESWFRDLKERVIWRNEFETIDQAPRGDRRLVDHYHDRPHLGIDYRTPKEVRQTWEDAREEFDGLEKQAA